MKILDLLAILIGGFVGSGVALTLGSILIGMFIGSVITGMFSRDGDAFIDIGARGIGAGIFMVIFSKYILLADMYSLPISAALYALLIGPFGGTIGYFLAGNKK